MTQEEAVTWLFEVDGELYKTPSRDADRDVWVAVVRTPSSGPQKGKLIVALGDSLQEATEAAAFQWESQWAELSAVH